MVDQDRTQGLLSPMEQCIFLVSVVGPHFLRPPLLFDCRSAKFLPRNFLIIKRFLHVIWKYPIRIDTDKPHSTGGKTNATRNQNPQMVFSCLDCLELVRGFPGAFLVLILFFVEELYLSRQFEHSAHAHWHTHP